MVECLRCLYHHMLSVSYIYKENWVVFLCYCAVLWCAQMSNYRPMVVFVILQITPFHYHHYADVSENIELPKCFSVQTVVCVSKIKPILSINVMIVRIFTLSNYQCQIGSMSHLPLLRVRSWNNGIPWKPFYVLIMTLWHGNIFRVTCPLWRESTSHRGILRRNEW